MKVVYNNLLIDDDTDEVYKDPNNKDIIELLLEFPNFINNNYVKTRLKEMLPYIK